ncbi:MAG TPA: FHA domain-containing protein [Vampirovibrionales bacterium]
MAYFITDSGQSIALEVQGPEGILLGREGNECNILIPDDSISRNHAKLAVSPTGQYCLSDLNSTNGTFINDQQISSGKFYALEEGDILTFGKVNLKFSAQAALEAAMKADNNPQEPEN